MFPAGTVCQIRNNLNSTERFYMLHAGTVYITVLLAFHRYVHVCRPEDTDRLSGTRRATIHVIVVVVFAIFYSLPRLFEYEFAPETTSPELKFLGVRTAASPSIPFNATSVRSGSHVVGGQPEVAFRNLTLASRSSTPKMIFSKIGKSVWFQIIYKNVCFYMFMYLIPLTVLIVVSVKLLQKLRLHRFQKPDSSLHRKQQSRDDNVTVVLIIVIVVFIVCQTPTVFQRLALALSGAEGLVCGHPYYYIERFSDYLAILNSCVNFIVYVTFARRFRRTLSTDILRMCGRKSTDLTAMGDDSSEMADCYAASSANTKDPSATVALLTSADNNQSSLNIDRGNSNETNHKSVSNLKNQSKQSIDSLNSIESIGFAADDIKKSQSKHSIVLLNSNEANHNAQKHCIARLYSIQLNQDSTNKE